MLRRVLRRTISLILSVLMVVSVALVFSYEASAADLTISVSNLAASYSSGSWSGADTTIEGSVTGTAKGRCDDATSSSGVLTLKNTSGSNAKIVFDVSRVTIGSGGYVKVDGTEYKAKGTFSKELAAGGSINIEILSGNPGAYTTNVTITNISLTILRDVTMTFVPAQGGGSYTVNGTTITEQTTYTQDSGTAYALAVKPDKGQKLEGWYSVTQKRFINASTSYSAYFDTNDTVYPVFIPESYAVWEVGSTWFTDLNEAISFSQSKNINQITLVGDGTLSAGDYTIPSGKTLLIPYNIGKNVNLSTPDVFAGMGNTSIANRKPFKTLTVANGANLKINGALCVNGKINSFNYGATGVTSGPFGYIYMEEGGTITVGQGGNLSCWGYISGSGEVTAKSGANVYEPLQIADLRGGTATSSIRGNSQKVMPFQQYFAQNIEAPLTIEYGATDTAIGAVTIQGSSAKPKMTFIGSQSGALFKLENGSKFRRFYNPSVDRMSYEIYGDASLNGVTLNVYITVETSSYVLPLMQNISINVKSGTTTLNQDVQMIPGCEVIIDNGAGLAISANNSVYVYDKDEYVGKKYTGVSSDFCNVPYSPTVKNRFNVNQMVDARIDVNGVITANGNLYTTNGGANIMSSNGTGRVKLNKVVDSATTYQAKQSGSNISYDAIPVTLAKLRNDAARYPDGNADAYTITAGNTKAGDTYSYDVTSGKWGTWKTYNVKFVNGDESTVVPVRENNKVTVPEDPTKDGFVFDGWYNGNNKFNFNTPITSDITLTAKWTEITLADPTYTWSDDNKTVTATAECAVDPSKTETETVETTVAETPATCEADGVTVYTATFENTLFEEQTKSIEISKLGHTWGEPVWTWASDNGSSKATFVCQNDANHKTVVDATISTKVTEDATCEKAGKLVRTATAEFGDHAYDNSVEEEIAALGHDYKVVEDSAVEATCEKAGKEADKKCSRCDNLIEGKAIAQKPHAAKKVGANAATCTEAGYEEYWKCDTCGKLFSDEACKNVIEKPVEIKALGHDYKPVDGTAVEATCEKAGKEADKKCSRCGDIIVGAETSKLAHAAKKVDAKAATCTEAGYEEYWKCDTCGKLFSDEACKNTIEKPVEIKALGHDYQVVEESAVEATCEKAGKEADKKCSRCGDLVEGKAIAETGHSATKVDAKEATCTEKGYEEYWKCDTCNMLFSDEACKNVIEEPVEVMALGHDYQAVEGSAVEATCEKAGKEADKKCSRCDDLIEGKAIAETGHSATKVEAKAATCTEAGHEEYWNCEACNKLFSDEACKNVIEEPVEIKALGHDYKTVEGSAVEATCEKAGKEADKKCSRCDDIVKGAEISMKAHTAKKVDAKEATCIEAGYEEYWKCDTCNKLFSDEACKNVIEKPVEIKALGHDYQVVEGSAVEATCEKAGKEADKKCSRCDDLIEGKVIPQLTHSATKVEAKAATCTEAGHEEYWKCETCGKLFSDEACKNVIEKPVEIKALGHDYQVVEGSAVEATCEKAGKEADKKCSRCDDLIEGKVIPQLTHSATKVEAKAATCTEAGHEEYWKCDACNKLFSDEACKNVIEKPVEIKALGHDYHAVEGSAVEATCEKAGKEADKKCSRCGDIIAGAEISMKAHATSKVDAKAATCTEAGYEEYWKCDTCNKLFSDENCKNAIEKPVEVKPLGHDYQIVEGSTVEATCEKAGKEADKKCSRCGDLIEGKAIAETGHSATKVDAKAATCTEAGHEAYWNCEACNKLFSDEACENVIEKPVEIKALGHDYKTVEGSAVEATCENAGKEADKKCSRCDDIIAGAEISKLAHVVKKVDAKAATCTEAGYEEYWKCDTCAKLFSDEACENVIEKPVEIKALGHDYQAVDGSAVEATCETAGKEADKKCSRCDDLIEGDAIAQKPHAAKKVGANAATCTEAGYEEYWKCDTCGKLFSDEACKNVIEKPVEVKAFGHDYKTVEGSAVEATCEKAGKEADKKCSRCGDLVEGKAIAETGHSAKKVDVKAATCTEAGYEEYWKCDTCGKLFSDEACKNVIEKPVEVKALGHDYKTVEGSAVEATCEKAGKEADKKCSRCGDLVEGKAIAETGHSAKKVDVKAATCTEAGHEEYWKCDACNKLFSDEACKNTIEKPVEIKALGHDYQIVEGSAVEATYSEDGKEADQQCSRCGDTIEGAVIPMKEKIDGDLLRIAGATRYSTAFKNADKLKELLHISKFDTVIVTTGDNYPDALSGSYLAAKNNAPLLLINNASAADVIEYIKKNTNPEATIIVLGSEKAVKKAWLAELTNYKIERIEGETRYETNLKILEAIGYKGGEILVATGENYADSLSGSSLDMPIMIVNGKSSLTQGQKEFLQGKNAEIYIAGSADAVNVKIENELKEQGKVIRRFAGATRYETSKLIADAFYPNAKMAVLTVGDNFPDGLSAGTIAAKCKAPILLTNNGKLSDAAASYAQAHNITDGIVIGKDDTNLITDATARKVLGNKKINRFEENMYK